MSAGEIERLTDVIVELLPGERELSERVARAVWREVRDAALARAEVAEEALRMLVEVRDMSAEERDDGSAWAMLDNAIDAAAAMADAMKEPTEFQFVRLTDLPDDADGRQRAADQPQGPSRAAERALWGHGDGTSEGEKR